jgi:cytoskeletal protein CcmA (bactofilin family)
MFFRHLIGRKERGVSLIGAGTRITGNVKFHGDLRIDGEVRGNVCSDNKFSSLVVSEHGLVDGGACAPHLIVGGVIVGSVVATGKLELRPSARMTGDVACGVIEIPPGAIIQGRLSVSRSEPIPPVELTDIVSRQLPRLVKV